MYLYVVVNGNANVEKTRNIIRLVYTVCTKCGHEEACDDNDVNKTETEAIRSVLCLVVWFGLVKHPSIETI